MIMSRTKNNKELLPLFLWRKTLDITICKVCKWGSIVQVNQVLSTKRKLGNLNPLKRGISTRVMHKACSRKQRGVSSGGQNSRKRLSIQGLPRTRHISLGGYDGKALNSPNFMLKAWSSHHASCHRNSSIYPKSKANWRLKSACPQDFYVLLPGWTGRLPFGKPLSLCTKCINSAHP